MHAIVNGEQICAIKLFTEKEIKKVFYMYEHWLFSHPLFEDFFVIIHGIWTIFTERKDH